MSNINIELPSSEELPQRYKDLQDIAKKNGFIELHDKIVQRSRDLNKRLMIMVVGQGNFGKSTLINNFLGKEVAPVNFLPMTWKIDIYYPTTGEEYAEIFWSGREIPEVVTIEKAKIICAAEEKKRSEKKKMTSTISHETAAEIQEVQWYLNVSNYSDEFCLVDTPGLGQQRDDTEIKSFNLFGSEGINLTSNEPFFKYYHRADLVLWCFRADKQNPKKTDEMLRRVQSYNKKIIGLITHMDKVPNNQWDEVKDQISSYFGNYVDDFICLAAGKDQELQEATYSTLRNELKEDILPKCEDLKKQSHLAFYQKEAQEFANHLDTIAKNYYQANCRTMFEAMKYAEQNLAVAVERLQSRSEEVIEEYFTEKINELPALWERASSSQKKTIDQFKVLLNENLSDCNELDQKLKTMAEVEFRALECSINNYLNLESWVSINLSGTDKEVLNTPVHIELKLYEKSLAQTSFGKIKSDEGDLEAVGVGAVGAAIGAFFLGPIGLLGAGIGLLAKAFFEKSKTLGKVSDALIESCEETTQQVIETILMSADQLLFNICSEIESSHNSYVGGDISDIIKIQKAFDIAGRRIGIIHSESSTLSAYQNKPQQAIYQFGVVRIMREYSDLILQHTDVYTDHFKKTIDEWDEVQHNAADALLDVHVKRSNVIIKQLTELKLRHESETNLDEAFAQLSKIDSDFRSLNNCAFNIFKNLHCALVSPTSHRFMLVSEDLFEKYSVARSQIELPFIEDYCNQQIEQNESIKKLSRRELEAVSNSEMALMGLHQARVDVKNRFTCETVQNHIESSKYKGIITNFKLAADYCKKEIDEQLYLIESYLGKHLETRLIDCENACHPDTAPSDVFEGLGLFYKSRREIIALENKTSDFLSADLRSMIKGRRVKVEAELIHYQIETVKLESQRLADDLTLSFDWYIRSDDFVLTVDESSITLKAIKLSSRNGDLEKISEYISSFKAIFNNIHELEDGISFDKELFTPYCDLLGKIEEHHNEMMGAMGTNKTYAPYGSHSLVYVVMSLFLMPTIAILTSKILDRGLAIMISLLCTVAIISLIYFIRRMMIMADLEEQLLVNARKSIVKTMNRLRHDYCANPFLYKSNKE